MSNTLPETAPSSNLDTLIEELYGPRADYRAAIATIADKAKAALPECNGRVEKAVALVLAGDVAFQADGSATVGSASDASATYHVVSGHCDCTDFARAPHGFCKHRLSIGIARRAQELLKAKVADTNGQVTAQSQPAQPDTATTPLPEAPVSITLKGLIHGQEVMVTLRGIDFASVKAQVEHASQWLDVKGSQPTDDTPQCATHGVAMKLDHGKDGSTWYSHKTVDGWCKGR